jgi:Zn-dependent protease
MNWWVSNTLDTVGPVWLVSWIIWVVGSIVLHELAHGWVALRCGDDVPLATGHMTANPFVHIPFPWAWITFVLFGFTWGLMPTNPANYRGRYDDAKVSFAGPAMNLLLAACCVAADVAWLKFGTGVQDPLFTNVHLFLWTGVMINMVGFVFNMVPFMPLDGFHILANLVPGYRKLWQGEFGAAAAMIAIAMLFFVGGGKIWEVAIRLSAWAVLEGADLVGATWHSPI